MGGEKNGGGTGNENKPSSNYYDSLGLDKNAQPDDIKGAYRRLAKKFHPDVNKEPDAAEKFRKIQEAYDGLSDEEKRAQYDQELNNASQQPGPTPFNRSRQNTRSYNPGRMDFTEEFNNAFRSSFGDMFDSIFANTNYRSGTRQSKQSPRPAPNPNTEDKSQSQPKREETVDEIMARINKETAEAMAQINRETAEAMSRIKKETDEMIRSSHDSAEEIKKYKPQTAEEIRQKYNMPTTEDILNKYKSPSVEDILNKYTPTASSEVPSSSDSVSKDESVHKRTSENISQNKSTPAEKESYEKTAWDFKSFKNYLKSATKGELLKQEQFPTTIDIGSFGKATDLCFSETQKDTGQQRERGIVFKQNLDDKLAQSPVFMGNTESVKMNISILTEGSRSEKVVGKTHSHPSHPVELPASPTDLMNLIIEPTSPHAHTISMLAVGKQRYLFMRTKDNNNFKTADEATTWSAKLSSELLEKGKGLSLGQQALQYNKAVLAFCEKYKVSMYIKSSSREDQIYTKAN